MHWRFVLLSQKPQSFSSPHCGSYRGIQIFRIFSAHVRCSVPEIVSGRFLAGIISRLVQLGRTTLSGRGGPVAVSLLLRTKVSTVLQVLVLVRGSTGNIVQEN